MFVVDFEVGDSDGVGDVGGDAGFDALEEVFACSRYETRLLVCAHHSVGFARTGLTVCENACVVAFEVVVQELFSKRVVYVFLVGVVLIRCLMRPKGVVEGELFLFNDLAAL